MLLATLRRQVFLPRGPYEALFHTKSSIYNCSRCLICVFFLDFGGNLGDNCIQNFHLGRYIVGYTVANSVLRRHTSGAVNMISDRISHDIAPQMKIFIMVIPILMHFCSFVSNWSIASHMKQHVTQQNVT